MFGTLLSFCVMAVGVREISSSITTSQVMLFRSVIGLVVVLVITVATKKYETLKTERLATHATRNLVHFAGQYGWLLGISVLPLAQVFAIEFTAPLWTAVIAWLVLGEPLTKRKFCAICLGLVGVLVILKPGFEVVNLYAIIVLLAAMCYAVSHTTTKSLSKTDTPLTILFFMCLLQLPIGAVLTLGHWVTPTSLEYGWLTIVGLTALSAHYCMTKAMLYAEVSTVVILDFLRLPAIGIVGALAYGESTSTSLFVGAIIMLIGNLLVIMPQRNKPQA